MIQPRMHTNLHELRSREIQSVRQRIREHSRPFAGLRGGLRLDLPIRTTMMNLRAQPARIWSAVTCHRFCRFGDLAPKQGRVQRPGKVERPPAFDGDKSPAESADKSTHSKVVAATPRCVYSWLIPFPTTNP